jgi:hypothetical protein
MKTISLVSLITIILFTATTLFTSDIEDNFTDADIFGWPFKFFIAAPENLIGAKDTFYGFNFAGDVVLCLLVAYFIRSILVAFKLERKKEKRIITQIIPAKRQRFSFRRSY